MTLHHVHRSKPFGSHGLRNGSHFSAARATHRIGMALRAIHRAMLAAKLRRLRREMMLHRCGNPPAQIDAARFPQPPLILGDKWDF